MAAARLSRLQQQILRWLVADHQRTRGMIASSHQELVRALHADKGNLSHSLRTLETHGLVAIGRSPGGQAESVRLTAAGYQRVARLPGSCD
jgi:DNA-binding MarR family transcriptional regulator